MLRTSPLIASLPIYKSALKTLLGTILVCALIAPVASVFAQSTAEVGRILLALGDTKLIRKGQSSALTKGATLQAGDTITTGVNSNLQMRMTDGAVIALRAGSEFKIDEYQFNGKADGTEKASLNLVQGGVRAVTGVIGRENKDNLKVNTVAATIGVRGTGFNIVDCSSSCLNADKSLAKNGLYAGVFEGKVVVKNDVSEGTYGVHEPIYVANKTAPIDRLKEPPVFLRDPLASQVIVPKKATAVVQPIQQPVNPPKEPADVAVGNASTSLTTIGPVTIFQTPELLWNFPNPSNIYNKTYNDGSTVATGFTNYMQIAQVWPGSTNPTNGLPYYSIDASSINPVDFPTPGSSGFKATYTGGYLSQVTLNGSYIAKDVNGNALPGVPLAYTQGAAQFLEGGNYQGVSWGRWGNGTVSQIAGYNNGQPIYVPIDSGMHFIVGQLAPSSALPTAGSSYTFNLLRASTPTAINGGQSWFVTGGTLTVGASSINGNLGLFSTTSGNANYNMAFSSQLVTKTNNNPVSGTVSNLTGNQGVCTSGCSATGNVSFYNSTASAAGLSYNFNTGSTFVQGVAVYKR